MKHFLEVDKLNCENTLVRLPGGKTTFLTSASYESLVPQHQYMDMRKVVFVALCSMIMGIILGVFIGWLAQ